MVPSHRSSCPKRLKCTPTHNRPKGISHNVPSYKLQRRAFNEAINRGGTAAFMNAFQHAAPQAHQVPQRGVINHELYDSGKKCFNPLCPLSRQTKGVPGERRERVAVATSVIYRTQCLHLISFYIISALHPEKMLAKGCVLCIQDLQVKLLLCPYAVIRWARYWFGLFNFLLHGLEPSS